MHTKSGFLLAVTKYGEQDAVLHCFTKEKAYESFFVKALYAPKNKKKAFLQALNELFLSFSISTKSHNLPIVSNIEKIKLFDSQNPKINAVLFFIADFLNHQLRNEDLPNPLLYSEIQKLCSEVSNENFNAHFIFLINLLNLNGISPLVNENHFLFPEEGLFCDFQKHHLFDREISEIWKQILVSDNPYLIKIPNAMKRNLLDGILYYYSIHSPIYREPNSYEIIKQIF